MPAKFETVKTRPALGHVNLMIDSFLANTSLNDLRAIVRTTLATSPPGTAAAFTAAARRRLEQTSVKAVIHPKGLFTEVDNGLSIPNNGLQNVLSSVRSMYGVGMGFASLGVLARIVRGTIGLRWAEDGEMVDTLVAIDADISQAIQSSREELAGGQASDRSSARAMVSDLGIALKDSRRDTEDWGGEFPFEKAAVSIQYWDF